MASTTRISVICCLGLLLSSYALYVDIQRHLDPDYVAFCDFGESMSCSKVFMSEWGSILYLPNSFYGILFYITGLILASIAHSSAFFATVLFAMAAVSVLGSMFLAGILIFVLKDFCLVCTGIYVVSILLLWETWKLRRWHLAKVQKRH
eukprot:gnl/Hemi2/5966_TR2073_c0_g1_i1.p1 gnl/Hemi2/5966_TR2073_c0_g1~~gnl/Hemi2/5966_TR2073_c0_g1_i1.p1  ORF type:complete len:165 (+),score=47.16 gnl/Hemi2/5966_TR2073_c0_g1_i1:51-497(+)